MLDDVLERSADLLERSETVRKRLAVALTYPAIVLIAAALLVAFLVVRIVPMFADLFSAFRVEPPLPARMLFALAAWSAHPAVWFAFGLAGTAAAVLWAAIHRNASARLVGDRLRLRAPVAGPLVRKAIAARLSRMLGALLHAGIELDRAITALVPLAGSPLFAQALRDASSAIGRGEPLSSPLTAAGLFDPLLVSMVAAGEESGRLDLMLERAAAYLDADVAAGVDTLGAAIEPALILVLGVIVAFILSSVFLPLYSLIGSVSS